MQPTIQQKKDVIAANIVWWVLLLTLAIWLVRVFVFHTQEPFYNPWTYLAVVGTVVLYKYICKAIRKQEKWGRIVLLILFISGLLGQLKVLGIALRTIHEDPLNIIGVIIYLVSYLVALVLLFNRAQIQVD